MKTTAGLFLIFLLFAAAAAQKRTDKDVEGLIGQVRAVRIDQARLTNKKGKSEEGPRITHVIGRYDSAGRLTEELRYANGCLASKSVYTYDAEGNSNQDIYDAEALTSQNISAHRLEIKPKRLKSVFKYDAQGNRTEQEYYDIDGRLLTKIVFTYGAAGRLTEKTNYWANGSVQSKFRFNYDGNGRIVEDIRTDYRASQPWKADYTYEFDLVGNWIKRIEVVSIIKDGKAVEQYKDAVYRSISYGSSPPRIDNSSGIGASDIQDNLAPAPCQLAVMSGSGRVLQGKARKQVEPNYPIPAKQARISGSVVVEVVVNELGNVMSATALNGPELLRDAAVEAAKKWKFDPAIRDGVPVKIIGTIGFDFHL